MTERKSPSTNSGFFDAAQSMEGFIIIDYVARFPAAAAQLATWVSEGKLVHREDIQEGIENAPETFLRLFRGQTIGKQLLKVGDPT